MEDEISRVAAALLGCVVAITASGCTSATANSPTSSFTPRPISYASGEPTGSVLEFDPSLLKVQQGSHFTVKVVQSTVIPTSGTQASVTFDRTRLQIVNVSWGDQQQDALVRIPDISEAEPLQEAISAANEQGKLKQFAAAFGSPNDIPAGTSDFLVIVFEATGCGQTTLGLPVGPVDGDLLDGRHGTYGNEVPLRGFSADVDITC